MEGHVGGLSSTATASEEVINGVRKGPWTAEEDSLLVEYVGIHGEGRWNTVAGAAGLKRTGKSCRLRWLNYLRPDVRRGNITLQEQLTILQLHSRWGNRWSKIAQYLPGRTDNEIKNYWRTRVQKQAKQLKCDVNSTRFRDTMRFVWMPRLLERIQSKSDSNFSDQLISTNRSNVFEEGKSDPKLMPELSGASASSGSDLINEYDCYNLLQQHGHSSGPNNVETDSQNESDNVCESGGWSKPGSDLLQSNNWLGGGDSLESLWNEENIWFLQQQLYDDEMTPFT